MAAIKGTRCECVDWIHLAKSMCQYRVLVNMVMFFGLSKMRGIS
jgi:hypothetical protein